MDIQLTTTCHEQCTHCFVDANPNGFHMPHSVFEETLDFIEKSEPFQINISGGELTTHPRFYEYVDVICSKFGEKTFINLLSNGSWLRNQNKTMQIANLMVKYKLLMMEIKTSKKYYPNYEFTMENKDFFEGISILNTADENGNILNSIPKIRVVDIGDIDIFPLGRGKNITTDPTTYPKSPLCTKFAVNSKQFKYNTLKEFFEKHQMAGAYCSVTISPKGDIHAGETHFCQIVGSVFDSQEKIIRGFKEFVPCKKCKVTVKQHNIRQVEKIENNQYIEGLKAMFSINKLNSKQNAKD